MPASLGPGLRTVSGASSQRTMFFSGSAGRNEFVSSINAPSPLRSAALRNGCAGDVFNAWHRPHDAATRTACFRPLPDRTATVTRVEQNRRRKCRLVSDLQPENSGGSRPGRRPEFRRISHVSERQKTCAEHCHLPPLFWHGSRGDYSCRALASMSAGPMVDFRSAKVDIRALRAKRVI
jgi:hypothetical protein